MKSDRHQNIALFIPQMGCPHGCSFCSQRVISGEGEEVTPFTVRKALREAFSLNPDPSRTEIAFFGGSFTCLPREEMTAFLEEAYPYVRDKRCKGIRLSTRPDGIDSEILDLLAAYGVTAVELGAQSLDDRVLALNGRGHTAQAVAEASRLIRERGFSLGLQIMTGLYGEEEESRRKTVQFVLNIHPDTIRIYPTVVLPGTKLSALIRSGDYIPLTVEEAVRITAPMLPVFEEAGIRIIRVGLHASREIEEKMLGGGYHPAFRELCDSFLFRESLKGLLAPFPKGSRVFIEVPERELSRAVGQKRENIRWAEAAGWKVKIVGSKREDIVCRAAPDGEKN